MITHVYIVLHETTGPRESTSLEVFSGPDLARQWALDRVEEGWTDSHGNPGVDLVEGWGKLFPTDDIQVWDGEAEFITLMAEEIRHGASNPEKG